MPSTCSFMYDHPDAVYYSGQILNGKIILTTDKVKSVRGVYITIQGYAKVRWTESRSRHNSHTNKTEHYTVEFRGDRQYLHSQTLVEGNLELPPGTHEYTFSTPLPPQIPSSISGEHGHVTYEVELKLDRPMRFDNVYTNMFTVIRGLDLNHDPYYLQPITDQEEKYFCCCCCASGPMKTELRTEFGGYAPGQKINFNVTIDNESDRDIEGCTVEIVQKIGFQSDSPEHKTKTEKSVIQSLELGGANKFAKKLHNGSFTIPPLPPSTKGSDDIINVYYYLRAEVETGCFSTNEVLHAGFTVGTVPLYASATNPNSVITIQPTAPIDGDNGGGDMPPQYGSVVPPSFEEATGMNKPFVDREADEHRTLDPYVPKYPVYHNFATPTAPGSEEMRLSKEAEAQQSSQPSEASAPPPMDLPSSPPMSSCPPSQGLPYPTENMAVMPGSSQPPQLPYPTHGIFGMPIPGSAARVTSAEDNQANQGSSGVGWQT